MSVGTIRRAVGTHQHGVGTPATELAPVLAVGNPARGALGPRLPSAEGCQHVVGCERLTQGSAISADRRSHPQLASCIYQLHGQLTSSSSHLTMTAAPTLAAGGADASSRVLHRSLAVGMPMATHAQGNYLYMSDGSRILDASGGAAVVSVGHGVPEIVSAVAKQVGTLPYVSSAVFGIEPAEELAKRMCDESGMARAIFLSGGSEAVESALKLCRPYHVENGQPARTKFISREISYHGNTMGALALGRHNRRRKLYLPLMPEGVFHSVSACNAWRFKTPGETDEAYVQRLADELDARISELGPETVAAFFAEPVVGAASGCVPFVPGYLRAMKRVCERHGVLFCLDEIMCGAGRSGKMHAWMHEGDEARPDVQTLGKGLCGGYAPLSAVLVGERVVEVMKKGTGAFVNGYTFQSSGTGTAAGLAVYDYIHKHKL